MLLKVATCSLFSCTHEIHAAHEQAMIQPDFARDLRIFQVDRLVNDCVRDSHAVPMQLDAGQSARQQILQKMRAKSSFPLVREFLTQIGDFSRRHLCHDPFFCWVQFPLTGLSGGGR